MAINTNEILATGRRKCAVARVRLVPGSGKITVNGKEMTVTLPFPQMADILWIRTFIRQSRE